MIFINQDVLLIALVFILYLNNCQFICSYVHGNLSKDQDVIDNN